MKQLETSSTLTLFASSQVRKFASSQVRKFASSQVRKFARKFASSQVLMFASSFENTIIATIKTLVLIIFSFPFNTISFAQNPNTTTPCNFNCISSITVSQIGCYGYSFTPVHDLNGPCNASHDTYWFINGVQAATSPILQYVFPTTGIFEIQVYFDFGSPLFCYETKILSFNVTEPSSGNSSCSLLCSGIAINGDFENMNCQCSTEQANLYLNQYQQYCVPEWFAAAGTPDLFCSSSAAYSGSVYNRCVINEGIYANMKFYPHRLYKLNMASKVTTDVGGGQIGRSRAFLANGLTPNVTPPGSFENPIPPFISNLGTTFPEIASQELCTNVWLEDCFEYTVDDNKEFSQLLIYPDHNGFFKQSIFHDKIAVTCELQEVRSFIAQKIGDQQFYFTPQFFHATQKGTISYVWNFGDGTTAVGATQTHTYATPGQYTVTLTATDEEGCCQTLTKVVTIPCLDIIASQLTCGTYVFDVQATNPAFTYQWSFGTYAGAVSTLKQPEYSYHKNGTYTVTLKIYNAQGHLFCTSVKSIKVTCFPEIIESCANASDGTPRIVISGISDDANNQHGPFLWSVFCQQNGLNPNLQATKKFFVRGVLITNVAVTFDKCEWVFDSGAELQQNANLTLTGGKMEGCNTMWKGIRNSAFLINALNTEIRDAEFAIGLFNTARANLSNSNFYNNFRGISASSNTNPLIYCAGNTFEKQGNIKPSYSGQSFYSDDLTGIYASNCNMVKVNGYSTSKNNFINIAHGIGINNGNGQITHNNFSMVSKSAISIVQCTSNNIIQYNSIKNGGGLGTGISIGAPKPNSTITISHNYDISDCLGGIYILNGSDCSINIHDNHSIKNNNFGIWVRGLQVPKRLSINNNAGTISDPAFQYNTVAIDISGVAGTNQCEIIGNRIRTHDFKQSFGINVSNSNYGWEVKDNHITIGNFTTFESNKSRGLVWATSAASLIENNTINGFGASTAYEFKSSPYNILNCNISSYGKTGFEFNNNNLATTFKANQINNITDAGLKLSNALINGVTVNGQVGAQAYKGNSWRGGNSSAKADFGTPILENQFIYNPSLTNPAPPAGATWEPALKLLGNANAIGWFVPQLNQLNATCVSNVSSPATQNLVTEFAAIINGALTANTYLEQNRWTAQTQLLQMLDQDAGLRTISQTVNNFYNSSLPVKQYHEKQKALGTFFLPTSQENIQLTNLGQQIQTEKTLLDQLILLSESDAISFESAITTKMNQLQQLHDALMAIHETIHQRGITNAQVLKTQVNALPEPFSFCSKHKLTLQASIDLILQNENFVNATYGTALKSIAEDCEFDVGNPVYYAQALCRQLSITYSEGLNCVENRSIENMEKTSTELLLYPNPASTELRVNLSTSFKKINVVSLDGSIQFSKSIEESSNTVIPIEKLQSGIYIVQVVDLNDKVYVAKFVKI